MMLADDLSFDELAATYDEFRTGYSKSLYDQLQGIGGFDPGASILDVACGTGLASYEFAKRGLKITGVDASKQMLVHAGLRNQDGEFMHGKAEELPFQDGQFDATICAQAIHWMDQPKAIGEMVRVAKPGGRVAIWWKKLSVDDPIRHCRQKAAEAAGVEPIGDIMPGSFKAFYEFPFKERVLRVIPYPIMSSIEKWLGYENSRRRKSVYGDKFETYVRALESIMREMAQERPFQIRYVQYLYVGEV